MNDILAKLNDAQLGAVTAPDGPVLVMAWPDPALPKTRRDARGPVLAALESQNITIVMPMRR